MSKQNKKQFPLDSKENCIIYLWRIISSCELCMDKFKKYNKQIKEVLDVYKNNDKIPYDTYSELLDKTGHVESYLLNLLGDCQSSSISYFKYRKQIEKLIKRGNTEIKINELNEEIKEVMSKFNKIRNWQNHVPESLLVSEIEVLQSRKQNLQYNPIIINYYNYVSYEYFESLYIINTNFYNAARKIIQIAKKDYSLLIGSTVSYTRRYIEEPVRMQKSEATKISAKIQGL